jgi:hypothetical protein
MKVKTPVFQRMPHSIQAFLKMFAELFPEALQFISQICPIPNNQFCRRRWGRGTHIRHKVAEGNVSFMPDGTDHGSRAQVYRPHHLRVIEGKEILKGTSPAGNDQHIRSPIYPAYSLRDCQMGQIPLDRSGREQDLYGESSADNIFDIFDHRSRWRGYHSDPDGERRKGPLAFRQKQPLSRELLFPALYEEMFLSFSSPTQVSYRYLRLTLRRIMIHVSERKNIQTIDNREGKGDHRTSPHHAVQQTGPALTLVREREPAVPALVEPDVGHFPTYPDVLKAPIFQYLLEYAGNFGHREDSLHRHGGRLWLEKRHRYSIRSHGL